MSKKRPSVNEEKNGRILVPPVPRAELPLTPTTFTHRHWDKLNTFFEGYYTSKP
jgi:hypothetical protein